MRRAAYVVSAIGFAFALWAAQALPRLSALPEDFPRHRIAYPARLGSVTVGSPGELRFLTETRPTGSLVEVRSGDSILRGRLVRQLSRFHFIVVLLEGIIFFLVNLIVFCPRVDRGPVRDFYWCTLLYGVAVLAGGVYFPRGPGVAAVIPSLAWLACIAALPVLFLHMTLTFPRRSDILDSRPWIMPALSVAAILLAAWRALALRGYIADPGPEAWAAAQLPRSLLGVFLVVVVGAGCLVLYRRGRRLELEREREQTTWLLWGFTVGVTPYVFLRTLPNLVGLHSPLPPELDRIFELAIPLAFTLAVVRYRFLDIDIIIRRSLIYGILAGVLAGIYLVVGVVVGDRIQASLPRYAELIRVGSIAIPIILFRPTRQWIGQWVDRTFFKIQYDFTRALVPLREQVRAAASQREIAQLCLLFLERMLLLRSGAVVALTLDGPIVEGELGNERSITAFRALETGFPASTRVIAAPNATSRPDLETPDLPEALGGAGIRLAVPLAAKDRWLGAILIGDKSTERRFVEEDLDLIERVRAEAVGALERVELVQAAAREAMEREKIQALERARTDLFNRVAHDLRTPLTSVQYTVRNILDGIGGPAPREHIDNLNAIDAATVQLRRLVDNLLDLSRLEQASIPTALAPVDLVREVERALIPLGPIAAARRLRFERCADPDLKPVRGDAAKLHEVVANLVENAARFSPEGGTVEIAVRREAPGRQSLVVRDHGPGIAEEEQEAIFERFRQGRPSPHSSQGGFGLGLFVVRSYLELMGGSVRAENHPEGGAVFTCTLGEWEDRG
jgi:signal transduction histidine kinase